jgi:hypothetical protein
MISSLLFSIACIGVPDSALVVLTRVFTKVAFDFAKVEILYENGFNFAKFRVIFHKIRFF